MFAETQPGSTVGSITIAIPQDRAGDALYIETEATSCPEGSDAGAPVYYEGKGGPTKPANRILCGCWSPCTEACENGSGSLDITGLEAQRASIDEWWNKGREAAGSGLIQDPRAWEEEGGGGALQELSLIHI